MWAALLKIYLVLVYTQAQSGFVKYVGTEFVPDLSYSFLYIGFFLFLYISIYFIICYQGAQGIWK